MKHSIGASIDSMRRTRTPEQRERRNFMARKRGQKGGKETPAQMRLRKQRRIVRLFGGDGAAASRASRKREFELAGRSYNPRGTLDAIAKRVQIKRLVKVLRRRVRSMQCEARRQHRLTDEAIQAARKRDADERRHDYHANPRSSIYHRVKRNIHKHLRDGKASRNWAVALGWTMDELKVHLERQFVHGMGWHNKGAWHIDHIRPVASFSFTCVDDPQFRECYALTNLRPLWGPDNAKKSDKRLYLL